MTVSFAEEHGSPREDWTDKGFTASRTLRCAWANRKTLAGELIGTEYPLISNTGAYCTRVSSQPFMAKQLGTGDEAAYADAIVTAEYTTDSPETSDLLYESIEPTLDMLTADWRRFRWGSNIGDPLTEDEAPAYQIRGLDYVVTKYKMAAVPDAYLVAIGCVNDSTVTPLSEGLSAWSFDAQTLLFVPPTLTRTTTTEGAGLWTANLRFSYKPNWDRSGASPVARGWNWFWRNKTRKYEQVYVVGSTDPVLLYPEYDFTEF